jgi:hypothetical protein
MTQVLSYQVPAHPSGLDMRTQLNAIVLAILGDNCGPNQPAEMYPGMMWGDTTANRLKRRTNANDAWVNIGPLDDFLGDLRTAVGNANTNANTKVSKTGDTMTGNLVLQGGANVTFTDSAAKTVGFLSNDPVTPYIGFTNTAGNQWVLAVNPKTGATTLTGHVDANSDFTHNGRVYLNYGPGCPQAGCGETVFSGAGGYRMFVRGGSAGNGGVEFVNNAYNSVPCFISDTGSISLVGGLSIGNGYTTINNDGNHVGNGVPGKNLYSDLSNKSYRGASTYWGAGLIQIGTIGANTGMASSPWVLGGLQGSGDGQWTSIKVFVADPYNG